MKRLFKRLGFIHWIAILFAVLLVGTAIQGILHPKPIYATRVDIWTLYKQMSRAFSEKVPKNSYSYFRVDYYSDETTRFLILDRWKVMLEIGVTDEAVIDDFLASWTGEGWDKLVKIPDDCSVAKQEEFIERAKAMDWGPGVELSGFTDSVGNGPGEVFSHREMSWPQINAYVKLSSGVWAEAASWEEMPQQLKDLAKEMGVPEEIIYWGSPELSEEPSKDLVPAEADLPDLKPGRVLAFGDERMNPKVSGQAERGTQAELDRWKEVVRDPAIARLDFNKLHQEEMELPVDQERRILTALRDAEVRLYEGNPNPSTGGGCTVIAYDGEENILFRANYLGDWFQVWFPAGDSYDRYYFDGEGTTLDALLRGEFGKAADAAPPEPDHAGDPDWPSSGPDPVTGPPDMDPQENPDTSVMYTDEENAAWQREFAFVNEIDHAFIYEAPKESYSYYTAYGEGFGKDMQLVLEVGVTDEAALDAYLAAWTGTKWDKLVKKPGRVSQAKQEEFAERAKKQDLGPNVYLDVQPDGGSTNTEYGKILVSVGDNRWKEAEQAVKDLAKEMGIPDDMLSYLEPRPTGSGNPDGTVTNPDT